MKTKIIWAELHAPIFIAGTNLGQKLDHKTKGGVSMEYDEERRHLYISYNGSTHRVPETSVLSMREGDVVELKPAPAASSGKPFEAQVSTPQSHVFAGPGGGDSGRGEKIKK